MSQGSNIESTPELLHLCVPVNGVFHRPLRTPFDITMAQSSGSYYRNLNAVTTSDTYPLPRIEELIDELGPTDTFTTLDARSAYWSIEVHPADRPKTAFSDGYRLFQFCRLPFGLSTAPTTFQRTINLVLSSVLGRHTLVYLDDIIVYSKGFSQHIRDLQETLQLLSAAGMKLNPEKCKFANTTINFLGFTISPEGVHPDRDKVSAISDTPVPCTIKEVRRFLGATGFFRKHIKGYATLAAPLHLLLKKGQHWEWGNQQHEAFIKLKEHLVSAPVLKQPDFTRPFELHTDASSIAIGAVLLQRDDDETPHAVAYYSRKLRDSETRYPAVDCEALAVVEGIRVFDSYLYGHKFLILTDHRPLVYIFKHRTKSPRMTRFAHDPSFYDFEIRYKEEFELKDGVLYRLRHLPDKIIYQLCVPESLHRSALKAAHEPPLAMHPGIHRTYHNLCNMFYWPNMLCDTRQYVQHCLSCQQAHGVAQRVPMAEAPLALYPLERVSMDIMDLGQAPLRWALTIIDQHSRFTQVIPLKDITASRVHRFLERTNRVVKAALSAVVGDHHRDWHKYIPELRLALNSAIHRSTGKQPLYLLTGRHAYFPLQKMHNRFTVEATIKELEEGQLVWYKEMVPRPLGPKWRGPTRVCKRFGPVSFEIQHLESGKVLRSHFNHLRPYHPPEELTYPDQEEPRDMEEVPEPDDPWIAILTTCVLDPVLKHGSE
ncbi:uncharacterized protein LOC125025520 [Penaeus chinensis]|uniref:uncharacterized protein LOC125025520 n=1 Tax=Penaeus chinensis TaxID=139456 RepID=UPI001FB84948|nr:uncharacterized protein LOC125025520 [Penaeus chinensis]